LKQIDNFFKKLTGFLSLKDVAQNPKAQEQVLKALLNPKNKQFVNDLNEIVNQLAQKAQEFNKEIQEKTQKYDKFPDDVARKLMILEQNPYQKIKIVDPRTSYEIDAKIEKYVPGQEIILKTDEGRNMVLKFSDNKNFIDYIRNMQLQQMGFGDALKSMLRQKMQGTPVGKAYDWLSPIFRGATLEEKRELVKLAYSLDILGLEKEVKEIDNIIKNS